MERFSAMQRCRCTRRRPAVLTFARVEMQKKCLRSRDLTFKSHARQLAVRARRRDFESQPPVSPAQVCQMTCTMSDKYQLVNASERNETVYHSVKHHFNVTLRSALLLRICPVWDVKTCFSVSRFASCWAVACGEVHG